MSAPIGEVIWRIRRGAVATRTPSRLEVTSRGRSVTVRSAGLDVLAEEPWVVADHEEVLAVGPVGP